MKHGKLTKCVTLFVAGLSISCVAFAGAFSAALQVEKDMALVLDNHVFGASDKLVIKKPMSEKQVLPADEVMLNQVEQAAVFIEAPMPHMSVFPEYWSNNVVKAALYGYELLGMKKEITSRGSGVKIGSDGKILTAAHVIFESKNIRVKHNGKWYDADVIKIDTAADVAVLQAKGMDSKNLLPIAKEIPKYGDMIYRLGYGGDSENLRVQQGNFAGVETKNNTGYAAVWVEGQHGDSGGAVLNQRGEVVAVTSEMTSDFMSKNGRMIFAGLMVNKTNYANSIAKGE